MLSSLHSCKTDLHTSCPIYTYTFITHSPFPFRRTFSIRRHVLDVHIQDQPRLMSCPHSFFLFLKKIFFRESSSLLPLDHLGLVIIEDAL